MKKWLLGISAIFLIIGALLMGIGLHLSSVNETIGYSPDSKTGDETIDFYLPIISLCGAPFFFVGLILFPFGAYFDLFKDLKNANIVNKPFFKINLQAVFFGCVFILSIILLLSFGVVFIPTIYYLMINNFLLTNQILAIQILTTMITALIVILVTIFFIRSYQFLRRVNIRDNYKQIKCIKKIAKTVSYLSIGTFCMYIVILILHLFTQYKFALLCYGLIVVEMIFFAFFSFFNSLQTKENRVVVSLLSFLDDYKTNDCNSNFYLINEASTLLISFIKPFNLNCSKSSISTTLSYQIIAEKDTSVITYIIKSIEKNPLDQRHLVLLIERILSKNKTLTSKGFTGVPSIQEKIEKNIGAITTILGIVSFITTIVPFILQPAWQQLLNTWLLII